MIEIATGVRRPAREGWIALSYFGLYLAYLFAARESELLHWITLVALPLALAVVLLPRGERGLGAALASVGLRRGHLMRGVGWAVAFGVAFGLFQAFFSSRAEEIQALVRSGRALWMYPLTFLLMMLLAGFTEEFFFRGFLQTRVEALLRSRWAAVLVVALLFGVYHLPYAYFNPNWPSAGDWGAAWAAALGNGVPGGLVLGVLYVKSRHNLLACMVLHSLINAAWAMTILKTGSG